MQIVPLQAVPSQTVRVTLASQYCQLFVYQRAFGLFIDVYVSSQLVLAGVLCQNLNRIIRSVYLGFIGDFAFIDNLGTDDPTYTGLGQRFVLAYLAPPDITVIEAALLTAAQATATTSSSQQIVTNSGAVLVTDVGTPITT